MISAAKVTKTIRQLDQMAVVITNFQTKYRGLPGDSSTVSCDTTNGNNKCDDGLVRGDRVSAREGENFWSDLSKGSDFMKPDGTLYQTVPATNTLLSSSYCPTLIIGNQKTTANAEFPCLYPDLSNLFHYKNWHYPTDFTAYANTTATQDPITPAELLAIDTKMDDGLAISPSASNSVRMSGEFNSSGSNTCTSGANYLPSNNTASCSIIFELDGISPSINIQRPIGGVF